MVSCDWSIIAVDFSRRSGEVKISGFSLIIQADIWAKAICFVHYPLTKVNG